MGLTDGNLLEYCKLTAERGVDVRTGAPAPSGMTNVRSHQSVEEHPTETLVKVWEDFARCGALFVSEDVLDLLADVQCAPMSGSTSRTTKASRRTRGGSCTTVATEGPRR